MAGKGPLIVTIQIMCSITLHGLGISRKTNDWPLEDCHGTNIDFILVADAATAMAGLPYGEHYHRQMQFFSRIIDVFMPPSETNLTRLRVSVLTSSANVNTSTPLIDTRIPFDYYNNKNDLKRAIENDNLTVSLKSYPLRVMLTLIKDTSKFRQDAEHVILMVVDGGRPTQITAVDADALGMFSTTNIRIIFVLIGVESALNLQTVFPRNNYIKVQASESLLAKQSIPVQLCKQCYLGWHKLWETDPDIGVTRVSCYKMFYEVNDINWLEAHEKCVTSSSALVSIESKREFLSLKSVLPEMIQTCLEADNSTIDNVNVYIGLTRMMPSLGQRFRWLNNMPLVYTNWGDGQPNSGSMKSCVVWNFSSTSIHKELEKVDSTGFFLNSTTFSFRLDKPFFSENYPSFWSSVGCGYSNGHFYLCESENKLITRNSELRIINLGSPRESSIQGAISRGELASFKSNTSLVAVSALLLKETNPIYIYTAYVDHEGNQSASLHPLKLFLCEDTSQTRIPFALVCEHKIHCLNSLDESVCRYRECDTRTEFKCKSGQCIPIEMYCDLHEDCLDKSDEDDCLLCQHGRCPDGRCIPYHWFADGEVDCSSCSNQGSIQGELEAAKFTDLNQCLFTCNRTQCVSRSMLNNSFIDCRGPEGPIDETLGALESMPCYTHLEPHQTKYSNWATKCIYIKARYNELLGCRDMKHLQDCEDFICPEGFFKCPRSYCIPTEYVQNSELDCPRGEDELDVSLRCPGYFICARTRICLHPDHVCDNHQHCPDGDDELSCNVTCREGFSCQGGAVVATSYNKSIPLTDFTFVDPRTRYLDVSGVNVSAVFPYFPKGYFLNILKANFSLCSIPMLNAAPATQNELRALLWLDLSYNLIEIIPVTNIFRYMIGLRSLNLSHNTQLTSLHNDAFTTYSTISVLLELDLSYTGITKITSALLLPLNSLRRLNLRNTLLADINRDMFPASFILQELDLRGIVVRYLHADMFKNVVIETKMYTDSFKLCCPQLHNASTAMNVCQSPRDPFSSCSDLMNVVILRILLWVDGFLAIFGNAVVIVYRIFFDRKILTMAYGQFVTHLSFSDLLMGVYLIIIAIADATYRGTYVWQELNWRNSMACKIAGFLSTLSSETSTFFIALITLDRFLVIKYPFGQMKIKGSVITVCCIMNWTLGILLALIPLLPPFEHWLVYNTSGMCLGLPLTNKRQPGWQFSTSIFVFLNFFLFLAITLGQLSIYRVMSDTRINQNNLANASSRRAQDFAIAKHLSLIALTDFLCWFPVGAMGLLALGGHVIGADAYAWTAVLILPLNSALNPILYTVPAVTQKLKQLKEQVSYYLAKILK